MKLKGWRSEFVEVELDEREVIESVIDVIRKKYDLKNVDGIDGKGRMYENAEYYTSHSWVTKEDKGIPTLLQKEALEVIKFLKDKLR